MPNDIEPASRERQRQDDAAARHFLYVEGDWLPTSAAETILGRETAARSLQTLAGSTDASRPLLRLRAKVLELRGADGRLLQRWFGELPYSIWTHAEEVRSDLAAGIFERVVPGENPLTYLAVGVEVNADDLESITGLSRTPKGSDRGTEDSAKARYGEKLERTGDPGRPSLGAELYVAEFVRRAANGEVEPELIDEARSLAAWFVKTHPGRQAPTWKTIRNRIRPLHRAASTK